MNWEEPRGPTGRRRWVVPVVAVVAIVLIAGAVLLSRDPSPATLSVGPTQPAAEDRAAAAVDPADFARRRLPPVETTTERPGSGPLLTDADLTLIAADDRGLQTIDLATGALRRIQILRPSRASLSDTVFTVGDTVVVDADTEVVALPPATPRPARVAANHRAIPTIDDGSVWVIDAFSPFVNATATRVGLDGTIHDRVGLTAVAEPLVGTADGLIVAAPGAIVAVAGDGQRRLIARGTALATDGDRLAWLQCTDDRSCVVNIGTVDDPARVSRSLDPTVLPAGYFGLFGLPIGAFSPDGRWLALPLYGSRSGRPEDVTVTVIDTATGTEAFRADGSTITSFATPLTWSPDSRWLLFMSGGDVRVWPAGGRRAMVLDVDVRAVRALAVR